MGNRQTGPSNPREAASFSYQYDYEHRLARAVKVSPAGTDTITFKYDPFGRRIEKSVATTEDGLPTTYKYTYVYDNEDIILEALERTQDGATTTAATTYIHGPGMDEPLSLTREGQTYYYHADGLGSVTAMTDANGAVVNRYAYDTFGRVQRAEAVRNAYAFTGREYDSETGLFYLRARYYDPEAGRFVSKDPIGFAGGDVNLYGYVSQNPVNWVDPTGLLTSAGAMAHYLGGSGASLDMQFNEINTAIVKAVMFRQVLSELVKGGCDRAINIDDEAYFSTSGDAATFLGTIRLRLQGTLIISNGTWSFRGGLSALPDRYDFNPSNHRTRAGEFSTTVGSYFPGTPYQIDIVGEKLLNQTGRIRY